jgi:hypothetical protein
MKLNDVQFVRAFALLRAIKTIDEKLVEQKATPERAKAVWKSATFDRSEGLNPLQMFTVQQGTQFAEILGVDFPDETKRETPQSLADWNACHKKQDRRAGGLNTLGFLLSIESFVNRRRNGKACIGRGNYS